MADDYIQLNGENGINGEDGRPPERNAVTGGAGGNGTIGEAVYFSAASITPTGEYSIRVQGGAGGYAGGGASGSWRINPDNSVTKGAGQAGGDGGAGGDAYAEIVGATSDRGLRVEAFGGRGAGGGGGGNAGAYPHGVSGAGANGGAAGMAAEAGDATAKILNSTLVSLRSSPFGANSIEISVGAQTDYGGEGGRGGYGSGGTSLGAGGRSSNGARGGDATAVISGNTLHVDDTIYLSALAANKPGGAGADASGNGSNSGIMTYTAPGAAGESGYTRVEISNNIIMESDYGTTVAVSLHGWGNNAIGGRTYIGNEEVAGVWAAPPLGDIVFSGNTISLGDGNDTFIFHMDITDSFTFTAVDNVITGGDGRDTLILGGGVYDHRDNSLLRYETQDMALLGISGFEVVLGNEGDNIIRGTDEDLEINGLDGNDQLFGGSGDDVLFGEGGDDVLTGGDGNDRLIGGNYGIDQMIGGRGDDTYIVDADDIVVELADEGHDTVETFLTSYTLQVHFEDLTYLGAEAFSGTGNDGDNAIRGGAANDILVGLDGDDLLNGGNGADRMAGGRGNDYYVVNDTGDKVIEKVGEGIDTVESQVAYKLGANLENLILIGERDLSGTGNDLDNHLIGNAGANALSGGVGADVLIGGLGNDRLNGGSGADRLEGGAGDDTYNVDNVGDVVVELDGEGFDTVLTTIDYILGEHVEKLVLRGAARVGTGNALDNVITGGNGADTLRGLGGNDTLVGGLGADTLDGGDGNDTLNGGAGRDIMTGGAGADQFVFASSDTSVERAKADRITDFSQADGDRINLSKIDAILATPADDKFRFMEDKPFARAGDLRYEHVGNETFVTGDINGDGVVDLLIRLDGIITLTRADFIL